MNISLASLGGASSSQVQWTMSYPPSAITSVTSVTGPSAAAAGKSVVCSGSAGVSTCIAFGLNQSVIGDGALASAAFAISPTATQSSLPVQISNVIASDATGQNIPSAGAGGTISVVSSSIPLRLSSVGCSPSYLGSGQSATCTVALNQSAGAATTIALASSSPLVKIPWSASIPAGASSATFSVITGTISASQTAVVTATLTGQSVSTAINLTPAVSLSALSCSPASINAPGSAACVVILSGPATGTGLAVSLANNNANAAVPGSVVVAAGSNTAAFTVTAGAVSAAQSATITAGAGGITQTFLLSLVPGSFGISGTITPSSLASSATVTLAGRQSTAANSLGNYSFTGLASGTYTLTPAKNGYTFSPASQLVTVNGANVTAGSFTAIPTTTYGTVTMDAQVRLDVTKMSSTAISPTFSTSAGNELLLVLIAAGYRNGHTNTAVNGVSGGGLSWTLVSRTQGQAGTAEIWKAFAPAPLNGASVTATLSQMVTSSMTVMSFAGVDPSGVNGSGAIGAIGQGSAAAGAPTASLVTTRPNSLVIGVGNDPVAATARTTGPGQNFLHQDLAVDGNTYWAQMLTNPVPVSGTRATINDFYPATDPYNLTMVEILPGLVALTQSSGVMTTSAVIRTASMAAASPATAASPSNAPILGNLSGGEVIYACSPGGLAALTGSVMTSQPAQAAATFPLPTELAGLQVLINGNAAPLLSASDSLVRFQCPLLAAGTTLNIVVEGPNGMSQTPGASLMEGASPELFGTSLSVIPLDATSELGMLNQPAAASTPARAGDNVTLYASGLGDFTGSVPAGTAAPSGTPASGALVLLQTQVRVFVGGTPVTPAFAGLAPGTVGLSAVGLQLPRGIITGPAIPLYLEITLPNGAVLESNEVTIAIQ